MSRPDEMPHPDIISPIISDTDEFMNLHAAEQSSADQPDGGSDAQPPSAPTSDNHAGPAETRSQRLLALLNDANTTTEEKASLVVDLFTTALLSCQGPHCPLCGEHGPQDDSQPPEYAETSATVLLDVSDFIDLSSLDNLPTLTHSCDGCVGLIMSVCAETQEAVKTLVRAQLKQWKTDYDQQRKKQEARHQKEMASQKGKYKEKIAQLEKKHAQQTLQVKQPTTASSQQSSIPGNATSVHGADASFPAYASPMPKRQPKKDFRAPPMDTMAEHSGAIIVYANTILDSSNLSATALSVEKIDLNLLKQLPPDEQDLIAAFMKKGGYAMDQIYMQRYHADLSFDPVANKKMVEHCPWVWMVVPWMDVPVSARVRDLNFASTMLGGQMVKLRPVLVTEIQETYGMKHDSFTFDGQGPRDHVGEDQQQFFIPLRHVSKHPAGYPPPIDALLVHGRDVPRGAHLKVLPEMFTWNMPMAPFAKGGIEPFSQALLDEITKDVQAAQSKTRREQMMVSRGLTQGVIDEVGKQVAEVRGQMDGKANFWSQQGATQHQTNMWARVLPNMDAFVESDHRSDLNPNSASTAMRDDQQHQDNSDTNESAGSGDSDEHYGGAFNPDRLRMLQAGATSPTLAPCDAVTEEMNERAREIYQQTRGRKNKRSKGKGEVTRTMEQVQNFSMGKAGEAAATGGNEQSNPFMARKESSRKRPAETDVDSPIGKKLKGTDE